MIIDSPTERLRQRVLLKIGDPSRAISSRDILCLEFDAGIVADIQNCLASEDLNSLSTGFLFLASFLEKYSAKEFGTNFMTFLVGRIPELLTNDNQLVRSRAFDYYVWLKNNYREFRSVMLNYLSSTDLGFRKAALNSFEAYSLKNEISPLVNLSSDLYVSESSMCGELRYELRDLALEKIELISGKKFTFDELYEPYEGGVVAWYDWSHFFVWWQKNKGLFS